MYITLSGSGSSSGCISCLISGKVHFGLDSNKLNLVHPYNRCVIVCLLCSWPTGGGLLTAAEICDLLKGVVLIVCCVVIHYIDVSMMYHIIRGQTVIKLYIFFNMLDVCSTCTYHCFFHLMAIFPDKPRLTLSHLGPRPSPFLEENYNYCYYYYYYNYYHYYY